MYLITHFLSMLLSYYLASGWRMKEGYYTPDNPVQTLGVYFRHLVFHNDAVNRNHAAISKFEFRTGCVHIELAGKQVLYR